MYFMQYILYAKLLNKWILIIILLFFIRHLAWYKQLLIGYDQYQIFKITLKDIFPTKIVLWRNFINESMSYDIMLRKCTWSFPLNLTLRIQWKIYVNSKIYQYLLLSSHTLILNEYFKECFMPSAFKRSINCWTFILQFCLLVSFELSQ